MKLKRIGSVLLRRCLLRLILNNGAKIRIIVLLASEGCGERGSGGRMGNVEFDD